MIFICLSEDPPDLGPALEAIRRHVEPYELEHTRGCFTCEYDIRANWKIVVENARECYHCLCVCVNYLTGEAEARCTLQDIRARESQGIMVRADVCAEADVVALVRETERALGPVDLLVNNAGHYVMATHEKLTPDLWRRTLEVNLTGAYLVSWAVKDAMIARRFGRIVNMSSISAFAPRPWSMAYAASKAGLVSLTKSCAAAWAPYDIRVNAVAPGLIETEMLHRSPRELVDQLIEQTPIKRALTNLGTLFR